MIPDTAIFAVSMVNWLAYFVIWWCVRKGVCKDLQQITVFVSTYGFLSTLNTSFVILKPPAGFSLGSLAGNINILLLGCACLMILALIGCINAYLNIKENR